MLVSVETHGHTVRNYPSWLPAKPKVTVWTTVAAWIYWESSVLIDVWHPECVLTHCGKLSATLLLLKYIVYCTAINLSSNLCIILSCRRLRPCLTDLVCLDRISSSHIILHEVKVWHFCTSLALHHEDKYYELRPSLPVRWYCMSCQFRGNPHKSYATREPWLCARFTSVSL